MSVLYHASTQKNLKILKPKKTFSVDGDYIGDYLFATNNLKYAAMYLVKLGNATLMNPYGNKPHIIIQNTLSNYLKKDKGGAIYYLPDLTFHKTPQSGLEKSELVSEVAVIPIEVKIYKNSLEAMNEMEINIYFVSKKDFNKFLETKNDKLLLPYFSPCNDYL